MPALATKSESSTARVWAEWAMWLSWSVMPTEMPLVTKAPTDSP